MSESAYLIMWVLYLISVTGFIVISWRFVQRLLRRVTPVLMLPLLALMLTPATVEEGRDALAPAFIVSLFEQLQNIGDGWVRAGVPLILALCAAIIFAILWIGYGLFRKKKSDKNAGEASQA